MLINLIVVVRPENIVKMHASDASFAAGKKIIVAGAGISGLAFVVALRKQWLSLSPSLTPPTITIYERDLKEFGIGREGYSISIRSDGHAAGMQALQKLGLIETMLAQSITGLQENPGTFCLWDKDWKEILRAKASPPAATINSPALQTPSMRIARGVLRRILIEAVPESDQIHWGTICTGATKLTNGRIGVQLGNGRMKECDLLVAADGSKSKLRSSIRPEDTLRFAGAIGIMGSSRFEEKVPPPANRDWGMYLSGTGAGLFVSPVDEHRAGWAVSYLSSGPREIPKPPFSKEQIDKILEEARERGKDFAEPFPTLLKATDPRTLGIINAMDKQPFPHLTGSLEGVPIVFIGDANHAVSPYAGSGANLALM